MSSPTYFIRRKDGQPEPPRARAGPSSGPPPSSTRSVSSTPSSSPSSSSTSLQTSPSPVRPAATTTSSPSPPPTSSPETSSSTPSPTSAPTEPSSSPILAIPPSEQTITLTSSITAQSSPSSSQTPLRSSRTSFFQNKPAMIAVFSVAGVVALVVVILLATAVVRRRRRSLLIKEAIDFSPTAAHLVDTYDDGGRSDNDDEKGAGSSLGSMSGSTSRRAHGPLSPSLVPPPVPVPSRREAQQQGPGTGFAGSGISYENSSYPYYDTGRPQWQQQPQQQLLPPPPQRQPHWRQQQAEWLQQQDIQSDAIRHPSALVPAHHQVAMQSQIPFARPARTSPPPGVAGGMWGSGPSRNEYVQAPSPAALNIPDTLRRGGGNSGVANSPSGQDFNHPRILKVVNEYY